MVDSTTKARRSIRATVIVAAGTATYFLTLLLVLYVLDRQVYTTKKMDLIKDNSIRLLNPPDTLRQLGHESLYSPNAQVRMAATANLSEAMKELVNGQSIFYRMELHDRDPSDRVITYAENIEKFARYNTWQNSLFVRNFSSRTTLPLRSSESSTEKPGSLVGYYTSPPHFAAIEQLTARYRWIAFGLVALWIGVYTFLYEYLLRPVRNVTAYLERSRDEAPRLMLSARGDLESGYNELAARALLQLIEERLSLPTRPDAEGQASDRVAAVTEALLLAAESFGVEKIVAAEISSANGQLAVTESFSPASQVEPVKDSEVIGELQTLIGQRDLDYLSDEGDFQVNPDGTGFNYCAPLAASIFLVITGKLNPRLPGSRFRFEGLRHACHALRRGFIAYRAYRQGIFRQRSEANIVLSRNLGHDLTNIIATSKLDLMAVRRLLESPASADEGTRGELLRQSVQGLLESTRFLQEIVNIYRSFSNVKRPQFERRDLKALVEEFLTAFEPSISSKVQIRREVDIPMPAPIIEPRLLKLALFNVLTNALDSLKRLPAENGQAAIIAVRALFDPVSQMYRIEVDDNGPGIRDIEGRLLAPAELQSIFEYGYSTKSEASEGLGLSWVRTIMTDFHDGGVTAKNLPHGGARFTLLLHSMERSEAKVSAA
jgi:signal transduction histidine kinase